MDLVNIIEKYIELSVKRDQLNSDIQTAKDNFNNAKIEGDMAFQDSNLKLEQRYNNTAEQNSELLNKKEKDLDASKIKEAAIIIAGKKDEAEQRVSQLLQYKEVYNSKGDAAYAEQNFEQEQKYNQTLMNYDKQLKEIQPLLHYYASFISDLNMKANLKTGEIPEQSSSAR